MNINIELFKRYKPEKKLEIINNLSTRELFLVQPSTILRIIKEAGNGSSAKVRSKFKTLRLCNKKGNNWNSEVIGIYNWKKDTIFLDVYIQGDDTDTYAECPISKLLNSSDTDICFGKIEETFSNGYSHSKPANYDTSDRASIIREILLTYVHSKYNI